MSRSDFVFVGLTKIFGPAYTMRTRTMRMSRMIPMIMPAPKPPSPVEPPGVLTLVCPTALVLLSQKPRYGCSRALAEDTSRPDANVRRLRALPEGAAGPTGADQPKAGRARG